MLTVEQAVQNGIELLDIAGPVDWRENIDLNELFMNSAYDCILGQLYGSYWQAPFVSSAKRIYGAQYGFHYALDFDEGFVDYTCQDLDDEWRRQLRTV